MQSLLTRHSQQVAVGYSERHSNYPVDPQFLTRWSPRAFTDSPVPEWHLMTMLEAARWAPSAYNIQPWRFLYSLRGDRYWQTYLALLAPDNAGWAQRAGALVFVLSDTLVAHSEPPRLSSSHSFDTGAAWIQLALQAQQLGYQAHALGGILRDDIRQQLAVPERFAIEIGVAIGVPGDLATLSPSLRAREKASGRLPLPALVSAGVFTEGRDTRENA